MRRQRIAGIYKIQRIGSDDCYVGQSIDTSKRWRVHLAKLRSGRHHSIFLQNVFNKHEQAILSFEVVEVLINPRKDVITAAEQKWINCLKPVFNTYPAGTSCAGNQRKPVSEETKLKMSAAKKGKPLTPEHRANLVAAKVGFRPTHSNIGRKHSEESRQKMSAALIGKRRGRKLSLETREKMSASRLGKPGTMKGRPHSEATRLKMSLSRLAYLEART